MSVSDSASEGSLEVSVCPHCQEAIGDTASATTPCCQILYHTKCLMSALFVANYRQDDILCPSCPQTILNQTDVATLIVQATNPATTPSGPQNTLVMLKETTQFKEDVKKLRAYRKKERDTYKAMTQRLRAVHTQFHGIVVPHLTAIRTAKKESLLAIRSSPEWKAWTIAQRTAQTFWKKLDTRYISLSGREMRESFGMNQFRYWHNRPKYILGRRFRIRL